MNFKKYILVVYILFSSLSLYSQQVEIIKDSVCIDGVWRELQELTFTHPQIYCAIQEDYNDFDTIFTDYKERLNYKKKLILDCNGIWECLREKDYVLEYYDINYQKNDILNVTLRTENFANTFIGIELFTFDLKEGKNLREEVFINKDKLLEIYREKIEEDYDDVKKDNDAYDEFSFEEIKPFLKPEFLRRLTDE